MADHSGNKKQVKIQPHQDIVNIARAFPPQKNPTLGPNACFPPAQTQLEDIKCLSLDVEHNGTSTWGLTSQNVHLLLHNPATLHLKRPDRSALNRTAKTPAKTAGPGFPPARAGASLSRLQRAGLSPTRPAWEAEGTQAPAVGTEGFQTRRTCSPRLRGLATPWPKPSGQSNQPGQVWARMFGTAVMPPRPQPARLPAAGARSAALTFGRAPAKWLLHHQARCSGTAVCRIRAPASSAEVTPVRRTKPGLIHLSWV